MGNFADDVVVGINRLAVKGLEAKSVRVGAKLSIRPSDEADGASDSWIVQNAAGHRLAFVKWPEQVAPASGTLVVTRTEPASGIAQAVDVNYFEGHFTPDPY